ncbi:MAG: hypothetical protein Q9216_006582 [Gyalolechia sp. 2 TL-2023]
MLAGPSLVFVLAAISTAAAAVLPSTNPRILNARQDTGVTCQTTDGSPRNVAVTDAINELKGRKEGKAICPQSNWGGSQCTTIVEQDSAAIAICGGSDILDDTGFECMKLAEFAMQIQSECADENLGRVGGTFTINASQRVVVFHT